MLKRCPQCLEHHEWPAAFLGQRGKPINWCQACQAQYRGWDKLSPEQKRARRRTHFMGTGSHRVRFSLRASNAKLGPIPVTMTERGSCPDACSFKDSGCYAEEHNWLKYHWERVAEKGLAWPAFCAAVAALPEGQLWRHNEAGDLPGRNERIDRGALMRLVLANRGRRGFTFTHKSVLPGAVPTTMAVRNARAIRDANAAGFTINLSADSLVHADALVRMKVGPVTVVVPTDHPTRATKTPAGNTVVVCPAETHDLTCEKCQMCAHPRRKAIIAFRAHGNSAALVSSLVREKR